ncbi:hypothetical protein SAMN05443668_106118 [Cryptosporangium aurantiacum]|uniref:Uncharacterized protein n=1 Tax=Cryptosporangium aurantiacum TaxID=134849 RepID=A0A1M7R264_9ACTN|nr:hypothetical protein SAMN05443668_106118 [Cryptosporangium aurantiacum]
MFCGVKYLHSEGIAARPESPGEDEVETDLTRRR